MNFASTSKILLDGSCSNVVVKCIKKHREHTNLVGCKLVGKVQVTRRRFRFKGHSEIFQNFINKQFYNTSNSENFHSPNFSIKTLDMKAMPSISARNLHLLIKISGATSNAFEEMESDYVKFRVHFLHRNVQNVARLLSELTWLQRAVINVNTDFQIARSGIKWSVKCCTLGWRWMLEMQAEMFIAKLHADNGWASGGKFQFEDIAADVAQRNVKMLDSELARGQSWSQASCFKLRLTLQT